MHHEAQRHSRTADEERPGPFLVAARTPYNALTLWHLLSLDAPTVATTWTAFISRCVGISLPWTTLAAVFLAVWMIYAADRLLDAKQASEEMEERHRFHHRHRRGFFAGMAAAAGLLIGLLPRLYAATLLLYAVLATLLAVWMLAIHARLPTETRRLPKELAVGVFFPAAVFLPTVALAPWLQLKLLPAALLFAMVCTLNCLYLYAWEHPTSRARGGAHWSTQLALRYLSQVSWVTVLLSLALALAGLKMLPFALEPALACGCSAMLLIGLHHLRARMSKLTLRALADLALLTPLLMWWVW